MNKSVIGIDLGTSSVKVVQRYSNGMILKVREKYEEISPKAWWNAICQALSKIRVLDVAAIGLSSQVGTYIINDSDVIGWNSGIGAEELTQIKSEYSKETFLREISMPHPSISSYPIPRLRYIKKNYPNLQKVCMPKDFICEQLTGNFVTDPYSWRGLANLEKKDYSQYFLNELGIDRKLLPEMLDFTQMAGYTKKIPLGGRFLPAGIPVFVGLNDYYAGLLGMGIQKEGDMFDVSGTSEHLGIIEKEVNMHTEMVSGPYLNGNVHYGVTASSGASLKYGRHLYKSDELDIGEIRKNNPPIFLPYLNGERAPIWDADARGMFFGISEGCSREDMYYSVMEGVVFSLYHIYEKMGKPPANQIKAAGGAAVFPILNQLKADMFEIPVAVLEESDTSAMGAVMSALFGLGYYETMEQAIKDVCSIKELVEPSGYDRKWLEKRFAIYKELYPAVKWQYEKLKEMSV